MKTGLSEVKLEGDWTISGVIKQIGPLTELSGRLDAQVTNVVIDCSAIEMIDASGFQVLYTWLQCLHLRGFQPRLVAFSAVVWDSQKSLRIDHEQTCFHAFLGN